ncbi:MAG TPA: hypothetical protein PKB02_10860 [Anaerohalosphaeraceae bacterium]|nr:hypothetical protein [Anaerohalosphaeraceae bacterium]
MNMQVLSNGLTSLIIRRYVGPFWYCRYWLKKTQKFSKEKLDQLQYVHMRQLIAHIERTVPYYQSIFNKIGFTSKEFQTLNDIKRIPILTKQDVLNAGDAIVSKHYCKQFLRKAHTGGTTGTPLNIYRSIASIGTEHAFVRRQYDWAGLGLQDRVAFLTGRVIVPPDQTGGRLYAYDPFMKELILSTYHLSEITAKDYLKTITQYQVKAIAGYPSAVSFLAKVCLDAGKTIPMKAVLTSSETITDSMRKTIMQAFSCPVYDFYGSAERVCYIFTCEQGSYHIQPEYGYTELIPVDETGLCKIVSTGFWNKAMPFIRYELGDLVIASGKKCSCGRSFPVVESISGRKADIIKTPSGREFGAAILTHLLYGVNHILESQIIQDQIDHLFIDYVPSVEFNSQDMQSFDYLIKYHLPTELRCEFRKVGAISKTNSGKIRPVISLLK